MCEVSNIQLIAVKSLRTRLLLVRPNSPTVDVTKSAECTEYLLHVHEGGANLFLVETPQSAQAWLTYTAMAIETFLCGALRNRAVWREFLLF